MDVDETLAELVARWGDRLLPVGYQLTHDRAGAQDIVQGALLTAYDSVRRRGSEPEDWYAYLRRAVVNEYLRTRRLRSSSEIVTAAPPEPLPGAGPEALVAARDQMWTALGMLAGRQRAVLGRGRRFVLVLAAAAVAAVIAGSVWAGARLSGGPAAPGRRHAAVSPLSCPARYARAAPWVPAGPSGVPAAGRLVPRRTPRSAVICAYDGSNIGPQAGWARSGRRVLSGGLARLAAELAWQPRKLPSQELACTLIGGPQVNYLIGLTYPGGGRLWVSATQDPNACVRSSNGEFTSFGLIGPLVTKAFGTGRWPPRPPASCRGHAGSGRLGQERAMVPAGVTSVTICGPRGRTLGSGFAGLVTALNALPVQLSTRSCYQGTPAHSPGYRLLFSYRAGPPLRVLVNRDCSPEVDNGGVQSASARTILPIIERLLR